MDVETEGGVGRPGTVFLGGEDIGFPVGGGSVAPPSTFGLAQPAVTRAKARQTANKPPLHLAVIIPSLLFKVRLQVWLVGCGGVGLGFPCGGVWFDFAPAADVSCGEESALVVVA